MFFAHLFSNVTSEVRKVFATVGPKLSRGDLARQWRTHLSQGKKRSELYRRVVDACKTEKMVSILDVCLLFLTSSLSVYPPRLTLQEQSWTTWFQPWRLFATFQIDAMSKLCCTLMKHTSCTTSSQMTWMAKHCMMACGRVWIASEALPFLPYFFPLSHLWRYWLHLLRLLGLLDNKIRRGLMLPSPKHRLTATQPFHFTLEYSRWRTLGISAFWHALGGHCMNPSSRGLSFANLSATDSGPWLKLTRKVAEWLTVPWD